ncbi:MAG: DUF4173 domain-containing protein [Gemmatimonadaceae bacterium]
MHRPPDNFDALIAGQRPALRHTAVVEAAPVNRPLARRIAGHALLLGLAGDALLRDLPVGTAFPVWIALLVLAITASAWSDGREISREAAAWLATAILFSLGLAWRDSSTLQGLDFVATVGALGMAAIALSHGSAAILAARFRDTVWATGMLALTGMAGFLPLAFRDLFSADARHGVASRLVSVFRAMLIGGTLLLIFGTLLRDADPIFKSLVTLPEFDLGTIASHVVVTGFYAWLVSGWARGALLVDLGKHPAPDDVPFGFSLLDVTTALGTLNALFAVFVIAQLGWFFGGEAFLHERTGLTASAYARQGFFQMLWVALLVIPLLVATRAALKPGRALERRHTVLSIPLIVLLGAILLSAAMRMKLYVHYYGLTTDRLYPLVFMAWLAVVLVWLAVTVLRGQGRPFIAGVAISGLAVLAALNVAAPDVFIAQFNLARATNAGRDAKTVLDLQSLANLSGEASGLATQATLAEDTHLGGASIADRRVQRCEAAKTLLTRWGPASKARTRSLSLDGWRFWNAGENKALNVVGTRSADLRRVMHRACKGFEPELASAGVTVH